MAQIKYFLTRRLQKLRTCYALYLPVTLVKCLGWQKGDLIKISIDENLKIILEKAGDADYLEQLKEQKVNQTQIEQK